MKTLRKLSNKKLDELERRIERRAKNSLFIMNYPPALDYWSKMVWRIMNERLRRIGL